jgi:hypothetical protein
MAVSQMLLFHFKKKTGKMAVSQMLLFHFKKRTGFPACSTNNILNVAV